MCASAALQIAKGTVTTPHKTKKTKGKMTPKSKYVKIQVLPTKLINCEFNFIYREFHHQQGCSFVIMNFVLYIRLLAEIEDYV